MLNVTDLGSGTPILWVHGFPFSASIWESQLALRAVEHVMPDLPGFGQSRSDGRALTIDDYARLMIGLLDQRGIDRAVFAGLSMGGYISLAMARLAPQRMRALILVDTRETPDTEEARQGRYASIEKVKKEGVKPLVDTMLPKLLTPAAPDEMKQRVREIMMSSSVEGTMAALRAMAERPDASAVLPKINVPTLIVVGEQDSITPPADAERMAKAIPHSRLVRIAEAAHLPCVQQAERFNGEVAKFVSGLQ